MGADIAKVENPKGDETGRRVRLSLDSQSSSCWFGETALEPQKATHHIRLKQGPSPP
jgi:hypothetical protein